ncbi:hypothetical protein K443DRAFT_438205 [Laccaria amethystina LaAM-08-1]|uniref:Unplaced genomic scaffold K443scaffold_38, whole genome shotgun sequence n=1 Tax=Laccaria amethystina LaAM-08-1 TaxID=1095629 RepID=A0A0C9XR33_9AGAR|nr:hypothetical protein K443DRAFT_438205 [Laccaria amethystina LaAM-08-1]
MPLLPAGTLLQTPSQISYEDATVIKDTTPRLAYHRPLTVLEPPGVPRLSWTLKRTWSIETASGVVALHDPGICTGHTTLDYILLGQDGYLRLINVKPVNGYCDAYVTPKLEQTLRDLAEARDISTLGIVLWQIVEEVGMFHRWKRSEPPIQVWRDGKRPLSNGIGIWLTAALIWMCCNLNSQYLCNIQIICAHVQRALRIVSRIFTQSNGVCFV